MARIKKVLPKELTEQEREYNALMEAKWSNAKLSRVVKVPCNASLMSHYEVLIKAGFGWLTDGEISVDLQNGFISVRVPQSKVFLTSCELKKNLVRLLLKSFSVSQNEITFRDNKAVIQKTIDAMHQEKLDAGNEGAKLEFEKEE